MHDKEFRAIFVLLLGMCAFWGFLFTVTTMVPEPGGFGLVFRLIVCSGLTVGCLTLLGLDLYGILTGHLPSRLDKH